MVDPYPVPGIPKEPLGFHTEWVNVSSSFPLGEGKGPCAGEFGLGFGFGLGMALMDLPFTEGTTGRNGGNTEMRKEGLRLERK